MAHGRQLQGGLRITWRGDSFKQASQQLWAEEGRGQEIRQPEDLKAGMKKGKGTHVKGAQSALIIGKKKLGVGRSWLLFLKCIYLAALSSMWDRAPRPRIEPVSPALDVRSPNHQTTGRVLSSSWLLNISGHQYFQCHGFLSRFSC